MLVKSQTDKLYHYFNITSFSDTMRTINNGYRITCVLKQENFFRQFFAKSGQKMERFRENYSRY